jgi:hypothetical protein
VKLLLADERVDPSAEDQYPIRFASAAGQLEVVKLLLTDKRVDPSAERQYAIRWASEKGHLEMVKLLLADKRVDPSADYQYAIRWSAHRGHLEVVKLLLFDQRVDISGISPPSSYPEILSLFLLRQAYRRKMFATKQQPNQDQLDILSVVADIEKIEAQRKSLLDAYLLSDLSNLCLGYVPDLFCHFEGKTSSLVEPNSNKFPRFSFAHLSTL